jgi:hypothetical protein
LTIRKYYNILILGIEIGKLISVFNRLQEDGDVS